MSKLSVTTLNFNRTIFMYPNLKLQLWKCRIRQNQLAKMLHMDETMLSRVVNGFREPSEEVRQRIATVLECDVSWLFERQEEHAPSVENALTVKAADGGQA